MPRKAVALTIPAAEAAVMCHGEIVTINLNTSDGEVDTSGPDVILGTPGADNYYAGGYAEVDASAVRVLLASRPDVLNDASLPAPVAQQLREHRANAAGLIAELTKEMWGVSDDVATTVMR